MGQKEENLKSILRQNGTVLINSLPVAFSAERLLNGSRGPEIKSVYKSLGGIEAEYAFRGKWDIITEKYVVELDEQLHFNSYRLTTLESPLYREIETFPLETYKEYCVKYKGECKSAGSYGKKWTSPSCEKMFGPAQENGLLSGNGSPRWKQRAFYDFVKDVSYLITGIHVVRLSVFDSIDYHGSEYSLGNLLERSHIRNEDLAILVQKWIDKQLVV